MKKILILLSLIITGSLFAQKDTVVIREGGFYVLSVNIIDKSYCSIDDNFIIYKVQIDSILIYSDTVLYKDINEMKKIDRVYSYNKEELFIDSSYRLYVNPEYSFTCVNLNYVFLDNEVVIQGEMLTVPVFEVNSYSYYKEKKYKKFWYKNILDRPDKFYNLPKNKKFYRTKIKRPKYIDCFNLFYPPPVLRHSVDNTQIPHVSH